MYICCYPTAFYALYILVLGIGYMVRGAKWCVQNGKKQYKFTFFSLSFSNNQIQVVKSHNTVYQPGL